MNKRIYLCLAHMSGEEQRYIREAFETNWVVPLGPNVNGFEDDLKRFVESGVHGGGNTCEKEIVALSAGTAAVHLALIECGVQAGDEVMCQSFTFCASCNPIAYLGATPVFVDSEPNTWNMSPTLLEEAINDRMLKTGRKPKAIVVVYLYGMPARIDEITSIAAKYDIPLIEDAAEGFGSRYKGRACGTFGRYGVLSFNGNKMITTSGGGALICPSAEAKRHAMFLATQAREAYPYYQHEQIGYNYRLSNICAGIGRGQMTVLEDHIAHHQHVQQMYEQLLSDVPGLHMHRQPDETATLADGSTMSVFDGNYWLCTLTIDADVRVKGQERAYAEAITSAVGGAAGVTHGGGMLHTACEPNANVEAMRLWMDERQVECRPVWKPMHAQPVYKDAPRYVNGVSESIFRTGLCLPAGPMVSDDDVRYIVGCIKDAL